MKERFGAKDPKAMMGRFHTQTAGSSLTFQQIENNLVLNKYIVNAHLVVLNLFILNL